MPNEKNVTGYEVTVRGQYFARNGKDKFLKNYGPITFFLPEVVDIPDGREIKKSTVGGKLTQVSTPKTARRSVTTGNVAMYVIQRRLLPVYLEEKFTDYVTFRTCHIVGSLRRVVRPATDIQDLENKPLEKMSLAELKTFCVIKRLDIPITAYRDTAEACEAVRQALEDAKQAAARAKKPSEIPIEEGPEGVETHEGGPVTSADEVPVDNQDLAEDLLS